MLEAGASVDDVVAQVGSSVQAVRSLRRRFVQTGSTEDLPRSGRPRLTTPAQDRYILNQHLRNRFLTASVTPGTHNPRISAQTVRNRLAENNLRARRPYVGIVLTDRHRRDRLHWADRHINRTRQDWRTILFSDESRFALSNSDGRIRVYRRRNERYADCCVLQRDRFGGGASVMVWAGKSYGYRTQLVVIDGNLDPPVVYSADRSGAVAPVLVLLFVALWFILRGDLLYVFPCVILFLCFLVLLVLRLPRLGKSELILVLFVRLFDLCLFGFVGFLFLLGSGKGCGL